MDHHLRIIISALIESYQPRVDLCGANIKKGIDESCYQVNCSNCPLAGSTYYVHSLIYLKKGYHEP